jgi:pseudouridine kinase
MSGGTGAVWVIGGLNGDVKARSSTDFTAGTSNPGIVERSPGGVGRNIAHSLALLEVPTVLLSAAGDDYEGGAILAATADAGVDVSGTTRLPGRRTGAYIALQDADGELVGAVADMEVMDELTPQLLAPYRRELAGAWGIVADTNIPATTLAWLTELCAAGGPPLFIEPVSVAKAARLTHGNIEAAWISPNRDELYRLYGLRAEEVLEHPELLDSGAERPPGRADLLLSLGSEGAALILRRQEGGREVIRRPALPVEAADVNGAGDSLLAGFVAALHQGRSPSQALEYGLAAAAVTVASPATVPPELCPAALERSLGEG